MALQSRLMRPDDVRDCVEVIASHPVIGPRYGSAISDLPAAWARLIDCEAQAMRLFTVGQGRRARVGFVGVSVFVTDAFVRELKASDRFWFGPELASRIVRGRSPVLSDKQLREANSGGGLNLLVWEGCPSPVLPVQGLRAVLPAFIEDHRGFLLKEIISSQVENVERLRWTLATGTMLWDPKRGRYVDSVERDPQEILRKPHVVGITRQLELERPVGGSWVGLLFQYETPRLGLSPSEQRMLRAALGAEGGTDQELADALGVSTPTIKKLWQSVYNRVSDREPPLIPGVTQTLRAERGKEKRRRLLAYMREHPEELRPYLARRVRAHH